MTFRHLAMIALLVLAACGRGGRDGDGGGAETAAVDRAAGCGGALAPVRATDYAALDFDFTRDTSEDGLTGLERALYEAIMAHRAGLGLPRVPLSRSLTAVAGRHAGDTARNILPGGGFRPGTNMHSWSDMDYSPDHANARLMWQTPRRLGTAYCASGYEISAMGMDSPAGALAIWLNSPAHRAVIENTGIWASNRWNAIGIGAAPIPGGGHIWHVWFGQDPDPAGTL